MAIDLYNFMRRLWEFHYKEMEASQMKADAIYNILIDAEPTLRH